MAVEIIKVNDGSITPIAFDVVGTAYEQIIKLDTSADGAGAPSLFDGKVAVTAGTAIITSGSIAVTAGTTIVTAGSVSVIAGTVNAGTVDLLKAGTITRVEGGTLGLITRTGNVGTLESGTITSVGTILGVGGIVSVDLVSGDIVAALGTINSGTITRLEGGTLNNLISGTINSATAVLNSGTINVATAVVTSGSIVVTAGTFVNNGGSAIAYGPAAAAAAAVGNPLNVGGTDTGGTIRSMVVDASGRVHTVMEVGTVNVGTISTLPNLPQGSINVTAGTITAGTLTNLISGTINAATAVLNSGTINVATAVVTSGTIQSAGTVTGVGVVTSITGIASGTINNSGTTTGVGVVTSITGIASGTINNSGTTTGVGVVSLLSAGTITKVEGGSIVVTAGTVIGNVASAATDSGNPVKVGGKYNATAPTLTDGQRGDAQLDVNANVKVTPATLIAGEDLTANVLKVEQRFSFLLISTATTTTVKSGAGFLHTITVMGGTAGTIIVYDNTAGSGTKILDIDSTAYIQTYILDISFSMGLTVVTGGATKLTVTYR